MNNNMTRYTTTNAVNFSTVKEMSRSPLHYQHILSTPRVDNDILRFGRLAHAIVLQPHTLDTDWHLWDGGKRWGRQWVACCDKAGGREWTYLPAERERAEALASAVRAHGVAASYLRHGSAEQCIYWQIADVDYKARVDLYDDTRGVVVEFKTTPDLSRHALRRTIEMYHYHTQLAWYCDGIAATGGAVTKCVWIFVETNPPHDVAVVRATDYQLALGRAEYMRWIEMLRTCRSTAAWPGSAPEEIIVDLDIATPVDDPENPDT